MLIDLGNFTSLKGMKFFATLSAKLEQTLCALAVVFHFVDLGRSLALEYGTPTKVIHGLYCLPD